MLIQKEMDEIRRQMDVEKDKINKAQQKTVNCIRDACAKVTLWFISLFMLFIYL